MVFSSLFFVFTFLPASLVAYFTLPGRLKNLVLLGLSLLFYAWGEGRYVLLLLASCLANWALGELIRRSARATTRRLWASMAVVLNLGLLAAMKYANFIADNVSAVLQWGGFAPVSLDPVHLPLGISFFTFQALSYVIDVRRGDAESQRNPLDVALYIALFPQLIAGPIVRYSDIAEQLRGRQHTTDGFCYGAMRFCVGLAKKVLIANAFSPVADGLFDLPAGSATFASAWVAALAYTAQIYFDFSGYSDMAIGLGHLFGFRLRENFAYPYTARSMTEFWRRWHISLSTWFRDYLYIPLGGNRRGPLRTYANLGAVFLLCGLWHGANWTFVAWGAFHGACLVLERWARSRSAPSWPLPLRHLYVMLAVVAGWVLFRSESLHAAWQHLGAMVGARGWVLLDPRVARLCDNHVLVLVPIAIVSSTPWLAGRLQSVRRPVALLATASLLCLTLATVELAAGTHNPFIYFRF